MRFATGGQSKKFVAEAVGIPIILPFGLIFPCRQEGLATIHFEWEQNHPAVLKFKMKSVKFRLAMED